MYILTKLPKQVRHLLFCNTRSQVSYKYIRRQVFFTGLDKASHLFWDKGAFLCSGVLAWCVSTSSCCNTASIFALRESLEPWCLFMEEVLLTGSDAAVAVVLLCPSLCCWIRRDVNASFCLAAAGACCFVVRKDKAEKTSSSSHQKTTLALVMELLLDVESLQFAFVAVLGCGEWMKGWRRTLPCRWREFLSECSQHVSFRFTREHNCSDFHIASVASPASAAHHPNLFLFILFLSDICSSPCLCVSCRFKRNISQWKWRKESRSRNQCLLRPHQRRWPRQFPWFKSFLQLHFQKDIPLKQTWEDVSLSSLL